MGLFSSLSGNPDDVPDTISEQRTREIKAAGQWAHRHESWFSAEAVERNDKQEP